MTNSEKKKGGRNPIEDRSQIKKRVWLFVEQGKIDKLGGEDIVKKICLSAIDAEIEKLDSESDVKPGY